MTSWEPSFGLLDAYGDLGQPHPELGKNPERRAFLGKGFGRIVDQTAPRRKRAERLLRLGVSGLTADSTGLLVGGLCLTRAVIQPLSIPLEQVVPARAIWVVMLGMIERDGARIFAGPAVGVTAIVVVGDVV